jgi:hypothetical protein
MRKGMLVRHITPWRHEIYGVGTVVSVDEWDRKAQVDWGHGCVFNEDTDDLREWVPSVGGSDQRATSKG